MTRLRGAALLALLGASLISGAARAGPPVASAPPPVVMIVFDEFPTTSLIGAGRRIDAVRYPSFAALARDATWFRNATTVHDSTIGSIPSILDGRPATRRVPPTEAGHPRNVFTLLARHGYRIQGSEEATRICPVRWCGPHRPTRSYLGHGRLERFDRLIASIRSGGAPTLYFKHTLLPHVPWIYLPSGRHYLHGVRPPISGINGQRGVGDPTLVRLSYERHLLQVGTADLELGKLLQRLRETGLYDRALIVLTADEGIGFRLGERDRRVVRHFNVQDVAPVPLFVKRPFQRRGRASGAYARTTDVLPTIADVLGIRIPWHTAGRSVFSRAVATRRTVRVAGRSRFEPVVKLTGGDFQRRWSAAIRRQHALFGYGDRGPGLFGAGPHPELIGRRIDQLAPAPLGRVRARLYGPDELSSVDLRRAFRPAFVAGRIDGGRRRARRDLAVAVNGRIETVTRSFYLRGSGAEQFACLIPESSILAANRVQILSVAGRGARLRLRLVGVAGP